MTATCGNESSSPGLRFPRSVSVDHAATLLGVSRRTVYNRIRDGQLRTVPTLGASRRVLVDSLFELGFRPQVFSASASAASMGLNAATRY